MNEFSYLIVVMMTVGSNGPHPKVFTEKLMKSRECYEYVYTHTYLEVNGPKKEWADETVLSTEYACLRLQDFQIKEIQELPAQ